MGTPNAGGVTMLSLPTLGAATGSLTIPAGGIPTTSVGVPIMKVLTMHAVLYGNDVISDVTHHVVNLSSE